MDRVHVTLRDYLGLRPTDDPNRWRLELHSPRAHPGRRDARRCGARRDRRGARGCNQSCAGPATARYLDARRTPRAARLDVSVKIAGHQPPKPVPCCASATSRCSSPSRGSHTRRDEPKDGWSRPSPPVLPTPGTARPRLPASSPCSITTRSASPRGAWATSSTVPRPRPLRAVVPTPRRSPSGDRGGRGVHRRPVDARPVRRARCADHGEQPRQHGPHRGARGHRMGDARRADRCDRAGVRPRRRPSGPEDGVLLGMATQTLVVRSAGAHGQSTRTTRRIAGDA